MNNIVHTVEIEGQEENMTLCAHVISSRGDKPDDTIFDVWFRWCDETGQHTNQVESSFNFTGETAIALRDFLISCFPLDKYK